MIKMRKHEYRAWEKNLKEIIPVHNIDFDKKMINIDIAWRRFDEIELMEYTGLKDKNGIEIYESDICKVNTFKGICIGEVVFRKGCFWVLFEEFNTVKNVLDPLHDNSKGTNFEVIGNIYQNPELLQK
jgi:uncharacterized phage protein (TIGR01671 family)